MVLPLGSAKDVIRPALSLAMLPGSRTTARDVSPATDYPPLTTHHSPLTIRHSPLTILPPSCMGLWRARRVPREKSPRHVSQDVPKLGAWVCCLFLAATSALLAVETEAG